LLKNFYIETFGCQMNRSDSDLMAVSLLEHGFHRVGKLSGADIAIFNTCSVRQHAEDRVIARILSTRGPVKKRGGIVVVAGCMAQRMGEQLLEEGVADMVIGPYESPGIGRILREYMEGDRATSFLSQEASDFRDRLSEGILGNLSRKQWHQWVTITHGCENFCAYCIVPHVRGRLMSFSSGRIIAHARSLLERGVREITLLGQNVNQYGQDTGDIPFHELLRSVASLPGLARLNFLTSHPKDFSSEIIEVIAANANISRSIHLPLQSGSDRVLSAMNRNYSMESYMKLVEALYRHLDEFTITTDLIVGFPGETEEDYPATRRAVRDIRFDDAYMYAYSPREGTPAYALEEFISRGEKIDRLNRLIDLQRGISREKLEARINMIEEIIPEKVSKKSDGQLLGRTFLNHPAVIQGNAGDIGRIMKIRVEAVRGSTLQGTRIA
jgi:tRNA-2-methylthio-N6-dimethylallyladenosine synthase